MPKIVTAKGKKFTFNDDVTNEEISRTIDEYFGVKKKEVSQPVVRKPQSVSKSKPITTPISSAIGETQAPMASAGSGGVSSVSSNRSMGSIMYGDAMPNQNLLIQSTPFDTKPKKYYRLVSDQKKEVEKKIAELEARNTRLGRRTEDLQREGMYQSLIKTKQQLDEEFKPAEIALQEVKKETSTWTRPIEVLTRAFTNNKYTLANNETIKLNNDVEDKIIDYFDNSPEEIKQKWNKGSLPTEQKEKIINSAKVDVLNDAFKILKKENSDYLTKIKDDPSIPQEEKNRIRTQLVDKNNAFNAQVALNFSGNLLKNNFKVTDKDKDLDEAIFSKYQGFIPETADMVSRFVEGAMNTMGKGATGIPTMALLGAERFNQITGASKPEDYTPTEATIDLINDTTNYNFLPSSKAEEGSIVDKEGNLNLSYRSITRSLADVLPFTLQIINDVKKGRVEGSPQSMISQLVNPNKNKAFADKLRATETAYKVTIGDNYREAKDLGMDDSKAFTYANVMSLAEGVSESIMPDIKYFDSLTGSAIKDNFKNSLKNAATKEAVKNVTKDLFKNTALELGEEEFTLAIEDGLKYSLLLNHENSEFFNIKRQKELVAATVIMSGALGGVAVPSKFKQNRTDIYREVYKNISGLQDEFLSEINSPATDEKTRQSLITAYKFSNDISNAIAKSPETVTADQVDLLVQKKNLEEKKKNIDSAFHPDINEEIAGIDSKIRELSKQTVVEDVVSEEEVVDKSQYTKAPFIFKKEDSEGGEEFVGHEIQKNHDTIIQKIVDKGVENKDSAEKIRDKIYKYLRNNGVLLGAFEINGVKEYVNGKVEGTLNTDFVDYRKPAPKAPTEEVVTEKPKIDEARKTNLTSDERFSLQQANKFENAKVGDEFNFEEYKDGEFKSYDTKVKEIVDGKIIFENGKTQDDISSYSNKTAEDAWFAKNKPTTEVISPETSSNYANLTENKDGDFVFFHVGGKGYDKIKKSTGGTIATSKEEAGALSKVGGVAMYYTSPEDSERMVNGEAKYAVTIPKEKVYDANTDPNNYAEQAKTLHEQENPGKAFDANTKAAYITKIAGENGYDMVVSEWMGKTRAQTTKEFAPTDVELKEGSTIVKPFEEQYTGNTKKGFKSIIPESKEAKLKAVYDEINTEKNRANEYDQLYRLAGQDNSKTPQEDITKLIEEDKTLSQEVKDKYAEALAYKPEQRRTELPVETQFQAHKKNGGSTFLANGENKAGSDASSVSIFTERSKIIDGEITEKDINDFKEANKDLFKGNEDILAVGTWYDSKSGKTYIDVSAVVPNEQAIKLGKQYNQKAVYNLKTNEEVDTGGTGEAIEGLKPEIERVNDIRDILNEKAPKAKPTVAKSKLEAFKAKYINKPVYDRAKLDTQVENAKKSLSKILPDVKFVVHDTKESFIKEAGKNGRGYYDPATKTIHINALEANARTVAHEVFHSVLLDKVKTDANARDLTKRMISSISKTLEGNPELKKNLDDFIKNYDENIQSEEKVAELFGYLAEGYEGFDAPTKSIIKRAMDRLAKMFGLKPFTEGEIVDMLKTLSGKVATGEEIVAKDIDIFKGGKKVDIPSDGLTKKFQYGNDKVNLEIKYLEQDRIDELKQSGLLTEPENLSELNGKKVVTTSPDDMLVGSILVNGKEVAVGNGGVYFVTKFGDVWANSNKGVANGLANAINETYDPETGKSYLALVKGTDAKLVSSPQGVTSSLAVTESMIDAGLFSLSDFRSAVRSAVKSNGGNISLSPNGSAKVLKSEVDDFFKDVTSSTFEKRGNVLRDIVSNLAKSESAKNNKNEIISFLDGDKNKGLGVGKTEKSQSLIDLIAKTSAEKLTKGLNTGDVYAVIEIDGKVKVVQDSHQSYPYHIKIIDENGNISNKKPVLILPKTRSNGKEILTSLEGKTAKELGTAFSGRVGATANMPYGKGIIMDNPKGRMQEVNDYNVISKKVLDKNEINTVRASLRASYKDSFALEILDAVSKGEQLGYDSELDATIEEMIQNGVTINNVANILMQDEYLVENKNITSKRKAVDYLLNIGVKGTILKAGQESISEGRMQESESYSDMKDIVQDMIDDGMTITEIKKTISSELGADQVSLAERAYNELTTVKEEVVPTNDVEAFRDKVKELPQSGIVGKYLSGETIEKVEGEAPRNAQDTEVMSLIDAGTHGKETVAMAKEVYGDKYIEKTLEFLDTANLKAHEKAVLYVSLENEMFDRVNAEPDNVGLKKLQDLVRAKSQQFLRESSLAINAGRLRAIMKDGFNYETVTDKFLSSDQLKDKRAIEKAIQSDANAIQKEYESIVAESDLEQMILSGVEKQVNEIYKKLPTARRAKADKAIAALEKIQNKLRGKAYDATVGIPIAIIDSGITIIKNSIKAGVSIADAIEIGINHIKEKYGNNWANEDMFRKDMTEGFKTEGITEKEIKAKELSKKELVKQALIDAGFGKEITVRTKEGKVKRDVLDWKKLAGEEGSVDKLRENVEKIIGKDAAKELEDEYNNLRASIIEKSLNELENRNTPRKKVDLKTSAKKLSELYNYGLFEKESDTYDHLINTALGMNQLDQKSFDEAKKLAKSLSELFSQKDSKGNPISQESLKHAERVLNKKIENLLSSVAWSQSNGAYKAIVVAKEFIGLAQRNALVSVAQAIENTTSGYISRVFKKIGFMFDNVDTKELKKSRNKLAQMTFKDITMNAGLEFGDVTSPFITKSKTMDLIVNANDSRLYHALTSTALGKPFLESADSMHKAALAQGFFHYNLIKILRKKGMSKTEAKNYVSENLTGQSFEDALITSKEIINKINENAGKKVISDSKESIYRFANDLVNEALVQGNKITLQELEASLKSAETVAGFELGHEPNNIISKPLNLFNSWVQTRTDRAVKDKKWNDAAALTAASIVTTNILNPYVGGGTNWTLLAAQKAGIPTLSTIYWNIKSRGSKLDLSTEEGMKNLEKDLKYQLLAKNANARMFIGAAVTLAAFALAKSTGADDDLYEWLKKNAWANKYMKKMNPPAVQFMLAQKDKKLGEFLGQQMNIKADAFDEGKKLQQAMKNAASGKTQKALGGAGQLVGSRLSTPIIPWRVVRDVRDIYRGLNGLPAVKYDYKSSGFGSGYFQGGMIEQLGMRPENVSDVNGNRGSSGNRMSSGDRGSSGNRSQSGKR